MNCDWPLHRRREVAADETQRNGAGWRRWAYLRAARRCRYAGAVLKESVGHINRLEGGRDKGGGRCVTTHGSGLKREDDVVDKVDVAIIELVAGRQLDLDATLVIARIPVAL